MSKLKLNIYCAERKNCGDGGEVDNHYFAAKDDTIARRYLNTLEEQIGNNTRFGPPVSLGVIKLDKQMFTKTYLAPAQEGVGILKLGKLEQFHVG